MKRICLSAVIVALLLPLVSVNAEMAENAGKSAWASYVYDAYTTPVASPDGYTPILKYYGEGGIRFSNPRDIFAAPDGKLYIADTQNSRILIFDRDLRHLDTIKFVNNNGMNDPLLFPEGIFVHQNGLIYIADTGKKRILVVDRNRTVVRVIKEPQIDLNDQTVEYKPGRLVVDSAGRIYLLAKGNFMGLLRFDENGRFDTYFGSNRVEVTPQIIIERFWRRLLTKEQQSAMIKFIPIEYSGVDIDSEDFIFTSVRYSANSVNELKKLNLLGNNVLAGNDYGDLDFVSERSNRIDTSFCDIDVDAQGFMNGLDLTRGRIFQYDQEGNMLYAFGTLGDQLGAFREPAALDSMGDRIYVLDAAENAVTVFQMTEYGRALREALMKNNDGLYQEAAEAWQKVIKHNANLELAYSGLGKALLREGRYEEAAEYFKIANDRQGYENAYPEIRREALKVYIPIAGVLIIAAFLAVKILKIIKKRRREVKRCG